jgi:hypothetical protein
MGKKNYETIIVGGGISGLACARRLSEKGKEFLLISNDIGGRILSSQDGAANLGAFFVCSDYYNFLKFAKKRDRIRLSDFCFHESNKNFVFYNPILLRYLFQMIKALRYLYKFRRAFRNLRKTCEKISQKNAIENDSFLYDLYMENAVDFIKRIHIENGTEKYLSKGLYSTTFSNINEMNAFSFLEFCLPLITPIYTFYFEKDKMIKPFMDSINYDFVVDISYNKGLYKIKTKKDIIKSKNIVLATEINWSKNIAGINKTNLNVSTNMYYIKGKANRIISRKRYHLFNPSSNVQAIADLNNDSFLLYYKNKKPPLDLYFNRFEIVESKTWNYAGTINGHNLIECKRGRNMYLIGDYNIAGLEEAFITGLFAANQLI